MSDPTSDLAALRAEAIRALDTLQAALREELRATGSTVAGLSRTVRLRVAERNLIEYRQELEGADL